MRKCAALGTIAAVIVASVCLRIDTAGPRAADVPARFPPFIDPPAVVVGRSESVQSGFRVGSEYDTVATQLAGTNALQEVRTAASELRVAPIEAEPAQPLPTRTLDISWHLPTIEPDLVVAPRPGAVARALTTAGRETRDAFRAVGRAIR